MKKNVGIAMGLSAMVYLTYAMVQPTYSYELLDRRFDAHKYAESYRYFRGITPDYLSSFPFNTRILSPWLAAHLPFHDLKMDFVGLNGLFVVLTVGLLTLIWQRLHLRLSVIGLGVFWVLFHWKGLVRMYLPDPVTADVVSYFWLTLLLLFGVVENKKWLFIVLVAALGTLQKESFIAVIGCMTLLNGVNSFVFNQSKRPFLIALSALLVALLAHSIASHFFPPPTSDWRNNSLVTLLRVAKRYFVEPELLARIPISWLLAFGTLWLSASPPKSPSPFWRGGLITFFSKKGEVSAYLQFQVVLWLFLSVFGGGDTSRIVFNGMPFVLTFLLVRLNQQPTWVTGYVFLTSLPLMRLYEVEPDLGRFPSETHRWCVECWTVSESWGYAVYALAVLAGYYYLLRHFNVIGGRKTEDI
ncbi:MAG TPA: hypothetical protein DCM71_00345 [Runella sp.]|nr:hypothetical protein [Runella sp.]